MSNPYVGEIRMFAGNFAPTGWKLCDGTLLSIAQYEVLFQLIGTTYGGDGEQTFALPDLRGRIPIHQGNGYVLATNGGSEEITLTVQQIPAHAHGMSGTAARPNRRNPKNTLPAITRDPLYAQPGATLPMAQNSTLLAGGSQPHNNLQPFLCLNFIISTEGIFPSPP
jgi:microcystin-dependent protein